MKAFHKFLDHTADIFFVAKAETLPALFEQCALATEETMVEVEKVKPKEKVKIMVESAKIDGLLFDFLDELVFFKDYKQLVFSKFEITIEEKNGKFNLACFAAGEKLDLTRHDPRVDVKAVTRHLFEVEQVDGGWKAQVLLDI
ncbi:TPA: archease [Candidatus Woesearchaeota archaeon]|nr:archease [Candidatus Woesearchaeota archaeon]HIG93241.1 archease [Candidatus Woesearchaeota archaeon]HIH12835.1 archease [Candidatus Woesearchaeota archaeon]